MCDPSRDPIARQESKAAGLSAQALMDPPGPRWTRVGVSAAGAVATLLLAGCGPSAPPPAPLLLGGPNTDITVEIPPGWHQTIDSSNPPIPEMVTPTTCMGNNEVTCALGLARIASLISPNEQAAEQLVEQALTATPGVKISATISQGPRKVGARDGYSHRFSFTNPGATLTCEIAIVPSGPSQPDAKGNQEFSLVLAWVTNKPGAPNPDVINQIIGSAKVSVDGHPPA